MALPPNISSTIRGGGGGGGGVLVYFLFLLSPVFFFGGGREVGVFYKWPLEKYFDEQRKSFLPKKVVQHGGLMSFGLPHYA